MMLFDNKLQQNAADLQHFNIAELYKATAMVCY